MREPSTLRSDRAVLPPCGRAVLVEQHLANFGLSQASCFCLFCELVLC